MNMTGTFAADFANARPVAQHCAELTARGPRPEEQAEHIAVWRRDLARELAPELGQMFSLGKLKVSLSEPETLAGNAVFARIGPVAANNLLRCGNNGETALFSLDYATAIALTDCSFGGEGSLPETVPEQLPRSAAMLVEQFATTLANAIALAATPASTGGDVLVRSENVARLKPFAADAGVALFRLTLARGEGQTGEWSAWLAVESARLDDILPGAGSNASAQSRHSAPGDGTAAPFADLPLQVEAVLSEFTLSLDRLQTLAPGDEIALTIPHELPLRVGGQVLALGALGSLENRIALRVTRLPGGAMPAHSLSHPAGSTDEYQGEFA